MKKGFKIQIIIGAVLLVGLTVALLLLFTREEEENLDRVSQKYDIADNEALIVLEKSIYSEKALIEGTGLYIPFDLVKKELNHDFYEDEDPDDDTLIYVLPTKIIKITPDKKFYYENDERVYPENPLFIVRDGVEYMELSFLNDISDMRCEYYNDPRRVVIHYQWIDFLRYDLKEETPMHIEPDVSSGVTMMLNSGESVFYLGGYGNRKKDFIRVMTYDGYFGYIQRKHVGKTRHETQMSSYVEPTGNHILYDEKIKLGWWYVASKSGNATYSECTKNTKGMNVISPTWFSLADDNGNINSVADKKYVARAHADGYKVWVLVDFPDGVVSPHNNLSRNSTRSALIANLVQETIDIGADGLNIDFEALSPQTGVHFVQFIKELSVRCHLAGLVLSVDNLVQSPSTAHYDIERQAKYADYIVMMTYDEHYAASREAGSVASIGFVRDAITDVAKVCDRERIIMGLPFYTRLWKSDSNGLSSEVYSIVAMEKYISKNDLTKIWDEKTCQNYIEYSKGNTNYKMWCEDSASIAYKCADAVSGELGGVAGWRIGLEDQEIWQTIDSYIK